MLKTKRSNSSREFLTWAGADALFGADYDTEFRATLFVLSSPNRFSGQVQYSQSRETHVILRLY